MKKSWNWEKKMNQLWTWMLGGVFGLQMIWIIYTNMFQIKDRLGFDASSLMLQSMEIVKQGTFLLSNWEYPTTLVWDSNIPLAVICYKLTGNIFLSWGIANLLMLAAVLAACWTIMRHWIKGVQGKLLVFNLYIGSYCMVDHYGYSLTANDLGYAAMMFLSTSIYAFKMLTFLLVIASLLDLEKGRKDRWAIFRYVVTILFLFVTGVSSGTYMVFIVLVPVMLWQILKVLIYNDFRRIRYSISGYLIGAVGVSFLGKKIAESLLGFTARDSGMNWCGHEQFWDNLGLFLIGFPQVITAMPPKSEIPVLSATGICIAAGILLVGFMIAAFWGMIGRLSRDKGRNDRDLLMSSLLLGNTAVLVLAYSVYPGQENHFQVRYLIPILLILFMGMGVWIEALDRKYIVSHACCLALILSIMAVDIRSDYTYHTTKTDYEELIQLSELVGKYSDTKVVFFYGNQPETQVTSRNLRVVDDSRIYKQVMENGSFLHWGDYTYFDDALEYPGEVVVICRVGQMNGAHDWMHNCEYMETFRDWEIYRLPQNTISL